MSRRGSQQQSSPPSIIDGLRHAVFSAAEPGTGVSWAAARHRIPWSTTAAVSFFGRPCIGAPLPPARLTFCRIGSGRSVPHARNVGIGPGLAMPPTARTTICSTTREGMRNMSREWFNSSGSRLRWASNGHRPDDDVIHIVRRTRRPNDADSSFLQCDLRRVPFLASAPWRQLRFAFFKFDSGSACCSPLLRPPRCLHRVLTGGPSRGTGTLPLRRPFFTSPL
jgi:hypothetical protein